jgi:hypothetical protein
MPKNKHCECYIDEKTLYIGNIYEVRLRENVNIDNEQYQ